MGESGGAGALSWVEGPPARPERTNGAPTKAAKRPNRPVAGFKRHTLPNPPPPSKKRASARSGAFLGYGACPMSTSCRVSAPRMGRSAETAPASRLGCALLDSPALCRSPRPGAAPAAWRNPGQPLRSPAPWRTAPQAPEACPGAGPRPRRRACAPWGLQPHPPAAQRLEGV